MRTPWNILALEWLLLGLRLILFIFPVNHVAALVVYTSGQPHISIMNLLIIYNNILAESLFFKVI
jgi:hypothetical protein